MNSAGFGNCVFWTRFSLICWSTRLDSSSVGWHDSADNIDLLSKLHAAQRLTMGAAFFCGRRSGMPRRPDDAPLPQPGVHAAATYRDLAR